MSNIFHLISFYLVNSKMKNTIYLVHITYRKIRTGAPTQATVSTFTPCAPLQLNTHVLIYKGLLVIQESKNTEKAGRWADNEEQDINVRNSPHGSAVEVNHKPFTGIEGKGLNRFYPMEMAPELRTQECCPGVGRIHVQPQVVPFTLLK